MIKRFLNVGDVARAAHKVALQISQEQGNRAVVLYGVPRGGYPAAQAVALALNVIGNPSFVTGDVQDADYVIDDLVDSGATLKRYQERFPDRPFRALYNKNNPEYKGAWLVFPWEGNEDATDETIEDNVTRIIQYVGDDPTRGGLLETPRRVAKAWKEWCCGYHVDPKDVLKVFEDGADGCDQMVTVAEIPIYSKCEHHMADIFGTATISYIPDKKIVGLSKLSRVANIFARRLQVQERLTNQIADAINTHLQPRGVGVCIKARHMCMESRGINQQGHHTVTTALRGVIRDEAEARSEFLRLAY